MNTIGDRVKGLRESKGISQRELGESIGLAFSSISAIENGRSESREALKSIAAYFKVDYNWLLNGEGETPEGVVIPIRKDLHENPYKDALIMELKAEIDFYKELLRNLTGGGAGKQSFLKVLNKAGAYKALLSTNAA
jgi:transcriptional regulator with XRE-family HTH domain